MNNFNFIVLLDKLLCSICVIEHQNNNNNLNIVIGNYDNNLKEEDKVISMEEACEKIKEKILKSLNLILSNRKIIDDRLLENNLKIEEINMQFERLRDEIYIEKLEIEKENIEKKIKEDEENLTQIEISNRMIKDMIQSLPPILILEKKYRDQIDHQISLVFESLYSFPLPQIEVDLNDNPDDLCMLNGRSYKGGRTSFVISNDRKQFIKKHRDHCGITVNKGISSGKYQWKISYDPVDDFGYLLIGVQLNKPICSSHSSYIEKETFGISIHNIKDGSSGGYYIGGKYSLVKENNLKVKSGEVLEVIVDCEEGIFQLISSTFNHSISIPILKQNEKYYPHFGAFASSFSLLSSEKLNDEKSKKGNITSTKNSSPVLRRGEQKPPFISFFYYLFFIIFSPFFNRGGKK